MDSVAGPSTSDTTRSAATGTATPHHLVVDDGRLFALDGLRGAAAVAIVLYHLQGLHMLAGEWFSSFHLCLELFFLLSGFILARQYASAIAERRLSFAGFVLRRLARLYPAYVFALLAIVVFTALGAPPLLEKHAIGYDPPILAAFLQLTMLHHIGWRNVEWNFPTWSMSVEWVVNLLFFWLVFRYRGVARAPIALATFFCVASLMRMSPKDLSLNLWQHKLGFLNAGVARGIVSIGIGALLYRARTVLPRLPIRLLHALEVALAASIALALAYGRTRPFAGVDYVQQLFFLPSLIVLTLYRDGWLGRILGSRPVVALGVISYSIYVLHIPVLTVFAPAYQALSPLAATIAYLVILLAVSTVSYRVVEKGGKRLILRVGASLGEGHFP